MEHCLYCGEQVTLLQRWKLGRAKGVFCSHEHEDAYIDLQAQAAERLMTKKDSEKARLSATGSELEWVALAPPAMAARPQAMPRSVVAFVHPKPVVPSLARPPLSAADASFATADSIAFRIAPPQSGRSQPSADGVSFESHVLALPIELLAPPTPALVAAVVPVPLPDPVVSAPLLRPDVSIVWAQSAVLFPRHSNGTSGATLRDAGMVPVDAPAAPGNLALHSCVSSLDALFLEPRTDVPMPGGTLPLQWKPASTVEHPQWVRSLAPPPTISIHAEPHWAHHGVRVRMPVDGVHAPASALFLAEASELLQPGSVRWDQGSRILESSPWWAMTEDLRFPRSNPADPRLRWCVRRPVALGVAGGEALAPAGGDANEFIPGEGTIYPSLYPSLYPALASAVKPASIWDALPPLLLDWPIGPPVGPAAGDCIVRLPVGLLALKRGAVEDARRRGVNRLPSFKPIPMQAIGGSSAPVVSFAPLSFAPLPLEPRWTKPRGKAVETGAAW